MIKVYRMQRPNSIIISCLVIIITLSVYQCRKEDEKIMKVRNDDVTEISSNSAKANAAIIDIGEGIDQHGHCWSINIEPTVIENENLTENGAANAVGSYSSILTGLSPGTKYFVRAYLKNGETVVYGADTKIFTTLSISLPVVNTGAVSDITTSGAKVAGNLSSLGSGVSELTQHGHCWSSETTTPIIDDNENKTSLGIRDATGEFESVLVGLSAGTLYYVRAYATNDAGTAYGDAVYFTTEQSSSIPSVITAAVSSVTATSAICGGSIASDGGLPIIAKGVCWDTDLNPATSDSHTNNGTGTASFASEITGLIENTIYYVRAYATNSVGTAYGNHVSFTASDEISIPTVTTTAASDITATSAVSGGNVTFDGGADVTSTGVCWNTAGSPTTADNHTTDGIGTGVFSSNITGLTSSTLYYVKAYATNSEGTAYGDQVSFTTLEEADLPIVVTASVTEITTTTAIGGGDVTYGGDSPVTAKGVCWNTTGSPKVSDDHTVDGAGTGVFTSNITGLDDNTEYYVKAYATNSAGTAYGEQLNFSTLYDPCTGITSFVYEGLEYSTIAIGNQCWMAENINVGSRINVSEDQLDNASIEKYCYDDLESNCDIYGGIYQWDELMQYSPSDSGTVGTTQGICPSGWHIPTDEEWKILEFELGMDPAELDLAGVWRGTDEGDKLKQEGNEYWDFPNEGATNETGFTALPSGGIVDKTFGGIGYFTDFWTATEYKLNTDGAWYRLLNADNGGVLRTAGLKVNGTPVRCIKD
jgi:uncharacterized protein (TIGR02145 family)